MTSIQSPREAVANHETDWARGIPWERYLNEEVHEHEELWRGVWERTRSPAEQLDRLSGIARAWRVLVLSEDWCGDASNTVPVLARFAADSPQLELRILKRDENLDLMDLYLTNGSRSIPLAIVLDESGTAVGYWGPRPVELQEMVITEKRAGERPMSEIYKDTRRWYAMDRGGTTIRELVDRIEEASTDG